MFVCYMLTCKATGGTYIGVTGQTLKRRQNQHAKTSRFPLGFTTDVLAERPTRPEINAIERREIASRSPTLNRMKGGTSTDGYKWHAADRPKREGVPRPILTHCAKGHELTSATRKRKNECRICARNSNRAWMKRKYGIGRGEDVDTRDA